MQILSRCSHCVNNAAERRGIDAARPVTKASFWGRALVQTRSLTKTVDFHLERCILDNWMRGSNSDLKRSCLVATDKRSRLPLAQISPCSPPAAVNVRVPVSMAPFVWSSASAHTSLELRLTKGCIVFFVFFSFLFLCTASLLAAHSQYPLIKPVTLSLTLTLKKKTKVTLCFQTGDAHQGCLSVILWTVALFLCDPCGSAFFFILFYVEPRSTLMSRSFLVLHTKFGKFLLTLTWGKKNPFIHSPMDAQTAAFQYIFPSRYRIIRGSR